jgi:2-iminobutanoate/2-iminopropanoate deaminase
MSRVFLCALALCVVACQSSERTALPRAHALVSRQIPAPIGPYSPAVARGDFVFVSGQIGVDPKTGELASGGIEAQTATALEYVRVLLAVDGLSLRHVVNVTVYLSDMDDFAAFNKVYATAFQPPMPARTTVAVKALPRGAQVEIQCTAMRP